MYTRCPSCRAEISFEPPANMESLPDGYKHRIKCPCCGVTIGVKINKIDTMATQPTYNPQNPYATNAAPVYRADNAPLAPVAKTKAKAEKKSGISRNVFVMICALLFIGLTVVGYLFNNGTIKLPEEGFDWVSYFCVFNGIDLWEVLVNDADLFAAAFEDVGFGIVTIIPMILFTLSCLIFVVDFICACCKKYGRVTNLIFGIIIGCCGMLMLFQPYLLVYTMAAAADAAEYMPKLGEVLKEMLLEQQGWLLVGSAGLGLVYLIFSCVFMKTLKKKRA